MREFLDDILNFIGSESLTDEEFASIVPTDPAISVEVYDALLAVLQVRESVSETRSRLKDYFSAGGADIPPVNDAKSNIFVGSEL